MKYETLEIELKGVTAWIWMNKPDVHNAFDEQLIAELTSAIDDLDAAEEVRVIVLAGRGKSFSAGADLNWMRRQGSASLEENLADAGNLAALFRTLAECATPTVARVHGAALGGGMGLASACDICIASDRASFATSEVKFGIIPAAISPYVLRAIGERQAYRYFQTAERIDAVRAREIGLAHEVTTNEGLDTEVEKIVEALKVGGAEVPKGGNRVDPCSRQSTGHSGRGGGHGSPHRNPSIHAGGEGRTCRIPRKAAGRVVEELTCFPKF